MYQLKDFFYTLFDEDDRINIRIIKDDNTGATNKLFVLSPEVSYRNSYQDAFPCAGINPRETVKKLSAIKNLVIDIDGAELPKWAKDRADMICSRDEMHHHLYFCFLPTDRETYKKTTEKLIKSFSFVDKMVSDPERVMRLPYYIHRKNGEENDGYRIVFIRDDIQRVNINDQFAWVKEVKSDKKVKSTMSSNIEYVRSVYKRKPILQKGEGRSRELFFLGLDCHTWGIELEQAIEIATEISNARYCPPENDVIIRKQVESAFKYAKNDFGHALQADTEAARKKERKFFEQVQRVREKLKTWVYVHTACRFIDTETGRTLTARDQIEDFISQAVGSTVSLRQLIAANALETCDNIEYAPRNCEKTYESDGVKYYNSYRCNKKDMPRDERLKLKAKKAFMEHINFIGTSPVERVALLNYFAYCVQHIGKKVDWTPLIISPREGLGKSAFSVLFRKIFGDHNCSTVSAHKLLSGWTDFVAEKLFVTSHEVETHESSALTELKTLITESRVVVNAKYARTYETSNCANFLLLSNKLTAIRLEKNSRRFFVIVNKQEPRDKAYYNNLFDAIENGCGWIYDFLMEVDLTKFDPHGAAPETEGLKMLTDATTPDAVAWLDERRELKQGAFSKSMLDVSSIELDATQYAPQNVTRYLTRKVITAYLHSAGYSPREHYIGGVHRRCWFYGDDEAFYKELESLKKTPDTKKDGGMF